MSLANNAGTNYSIDRLLVQAPRLIGGSPSDTCTVGTREDVFNDV